MLKSIILILLLSVNLFPQDFLKLYRSDIPDNIKIEPAISNSLSLNIKRNILLSPELIYLTLKYYQSYDGENFNSKLFENLKQNERLWFVKRNYWVKSTKEKILQNENYELISLTDQSLNDLIVEVKLKESDSLIHLNPTESNLRDFYIVKFYQNNAELKYGEHTNYSDIRNELEKAKLQYFKDVSDDPNLITTPQVFINQIVENWYLLETGKINAADILVDCIHSENINKARTPFSVFVGGVFINKIIDLNEKIKFPDLNRTITMNTKSTLPQFSVGVGYKLYFKKKSSYLSFLDLQLFYSLGYLAKSENYSYRSESIEYSVPTSVEEVIYSSGIYQLSSFNSFGIKIASPFYQLDFLSFELALNTSWDSYRFEPDLVFTHSKIRSSSTPTSVGDTVSISQFFLQSPKIKRQFSFMPMIDANLRIENGFNARISFGYGYFNMGIVYSTSLRKD